MTSLLYPFFRSLLFRLSAERAHDYSIKLLEVSQQLGAFSLAKSSIPNSHAVKLWGLNFPNRIGLAAGLDKNGRVIEALGSMGFGFIEVGTVTPIAQPGNPQPRLFRLKSEQAIINRMGFNNDGFAAMYQSILQSKRKYQGVVGINIGKNKVTPNDKAAADYLNGLVFFWQLADYLTINISSPNTPGLRDLQSLDTIADLLSKIKQKQLALQQETGKYTPVLLKISPDLAMADIPALASIFRNQGLDGLIATNTTISRPILHQKVALHQESGGLSGAPLANLSTQIIKAFYQELKDDIPIIGVGGISSVATAAEKYQAGAKLLQIYSGFIYQGPSLVKQLQQVSPNK